MSTQGQISYLKGYAVNTNKALDFGNGFSFADMLMELLSANTPERLGAFIRKHGPLHPVRVKGDDKQQLKYQLLLQLSSVPIHQEDEFYYNGFDQYVIWIVYELNNALTERNVSRCREALGWLHITENPQIMSDEQVFEASRYYITSEIEEQVKNIEFRMKWNNDTNRFERIIFAPALICCMYYELMNMITDNIPMRTCENPTCKRVFAITGGDYRKRFCSRECLEMVKQRRYRERQKQKKEAAANGEHPKD